MNDRPMLARASGGARVHVTTCRYARDSDTAVRWTWSDDKNSGQIARAITAAGLQACRTCKPVGALARWEHEQRVAQRPTGATATTEELLEFERANPASSGRKWERVRTQFGMTAPQYLQLLRAAVATEEALAHDGLLAHQIDDRIRGNATRRAALLDRGRRARNTATGAAPGCDMDRRGREDVDAGRLRRGAGAADDRVPDHDLPAGRDSAIVAARDADSGAVR